MSSPDTGLPELADANAAPPLPPSSVVLPQDHSDTKVEAELDDRGLLRRVFLSGNHRGLKALAGCLGVVGLVLIFWQALSTGGKDAAMFVVMGAVICTVIWLLKEKAGRR
jgi:hypothetical protein